MMNDLFASFTARKETLLERIGYVVLGCPIVWSFGMALGYNPPSCGRFQPLTSFVLIDYQSIILSRGNCDISCAQRMSIICETPSIRDIAFQGTANSMQHRMLISDHILYAFECPLGDGSVSCKTRDF